MTWPAVLARWTEAADGKVQESANYEVSPLAVTTFENSTLRIVVSALFSAYAHRYFRTPHYFSTRLGPRCYRHISNTYLRDPFHILRRDSTSSLN